MQCQSVFGSYSVIGWPSALWEDTLSGVPVVCLSHFIPLLFCRLHPKNCLGVRQFAETMMCTTLYDTANSFVHQHFVDVSMSEEFLCLRPEELLELVGCDELNIKAEEQASNGAIREAFSGQMLSRCCFVKHLSTKASVPYPKVFEAVLAWVRHECVERGSLLPELLSKTRLPLCRPQFLADRVQQDELVRSCHKCRWLTFKV